MGKWGGEQRLSRDPNPRCLSLKGSLSGVPACHLSTGEVEERGCYESKGIQGDTATFRQRVWATGCDLHLKRVQAVDHQSHTYLHLFDSLFWFN